MRAVSSLTASVTATLFRVADRPEWDDTFQSIAHIWAKRSTCSRRKVGAVVVKNNRVIGQGYNGVPSGQVHCIDGGCPRGQLSYDQVKAGSDYNIYPCKAIHAEHNAILQAGWEACQGADIYVTFSPCVQCSNLIEHVGIARVVLV